MFDKFLQLIFNLIMLPILIGLVSSLCIYFVLDMNKKSEIRGIVFTQALEEKYKFKSHLLEEFFINWQKNKIKNGELK